MPRHAAPIPDQPFGLVKFVYWGALVLILLANLFLSIFLSNHARQVILDKQHDLAQLLGDTLNNAISKRFYIPNYWITEGKADLSNPEQYKRLDDVIRSVQEDSPVRDVRVYDLDGVLVYAQDKALEGQNGLGGGALAQALAQEKFNHEFIYQTGALGAFFSADMVPHSVVMRTVGPLRIKGIVPLPPAAGSRESPESQTQPDENQSDLAEVEGIIGGLEFSLDITADYQKVVTFQRIIIASALGTAVVTFLLLLTIIHRANRINAQRLGEREALERKLMQSEKLAGMGRVVAGIAHEIRNPLGIIRSSSELLIKRQKDKDPLTVKILEAIHQEAVRLSKTVGDFLDYARPKPPRLALVDLGQVLDQALTFLEQKCREQGVEVVRQYEPGLMVMGDKDLLYRALYNILVNALESMSQTPGEPGEAPLGQIVVRGETAGGQVRLSILDTGPGFPAELKDKLLDPFFTTKDHGTGLGLAIVASIVQSHGASLALADNPEGGARVDMAFAKA